MKLVLDVCSSTNEELKKQNPLELTNGSWVLARRQTSGKGRQGRAWNSLGGNLFLSVWVELSSSQYITWVSLAGAVSTLKALQEIELNEGVLIKWPNDLYLGTGKLGGILCESVGRGQEKVQVVVGIGLNTAVKPEVDGVDTACLSLKSPVDLELMAEMISKNLVSEIENLEANGPSHLQDYYFKNSLLKKGMQITWGDSLSGIVMGLGPYGELEVQSDGLSKGQLMRLFSEDVKIKWS